MAFTTSDICKIIIAIFLPPVGVFLERGCGADFVSLTSLPPSFPADPSPSSSTSCSQFWATCTSLFLPLYRHPSHTIQQSRNHSWQVPSRALPVPALTSCPALYIILKY
ncbi:hypothetical protein BDN70DRAFT_873288 [Pholiota conissans]|uniref:Uncharacterized protein n=1 Tax=Pholiota conissans TaxID=109636 RepID=A0A9P5ZCB8_9AGAR|nr:hypothetical protein BDN70DRAFT_873288 [Pholiota conissans]